ncbi:hypothetical protein S1361_13700 [Streptomyces cyanogenus]|uniref:Lipoprotein n=1 Tax=Streptomyces cyanogenus TaxID=80860 RepID=A0ABX7TNV6_STRCY|nr:hypothetical protein S1361_13700 [Streptomyces cyanogenus]
MSGNSSAVPVEVSLPRWRRTGLTAFLCAVCLTGCATLGERETAASRAAVRFEESVRRGDGPRGCAALAPQTRQEVEQSAESPCAKALPDEQLPYGGAVREVQVYGRQAQVVLDGDTVFLSAFPAGWLITAAGCVPRPEQPYQCKVKGG